MRSSALVSFLALTLTGCGGQVTADGLGVEQATLTALEGSVVEAVRNGQSKITICHIPPGNPANAHTITVGAPAVPAHLAHGDTLDGCGECGDGTRSAAEECEGTDFGHDDCMSLGFGEGTLVCTSECTIDTSGCAEPPPPNDPGSGPPSPGECGTCNAEGSCASCVTNADCCSPLACSNGVCALVF